MTERKSATGSRQAVKKSPYSESDVIKAERESLTKSIHLLTITIREIGVKISKQTKTIQDLGGKLNKLEGKLSQLESRINRLSQK